MRSQQKLSMILLILLFSFFNVSAQLVIDDEPAAYHFKKGEHLEFKLSYGWFTVGNAAVDIDNEFHTYKNRDCYKIEARGATSGLLGVFTHVDDKWGAYVTKDELKPLHAYRDIEEGKFKRIENTYFDHESGKVEVKRYNPTKKERQPGKVFDIHDNVYDLMSSYLYLRNTDFSKFNKGDTIRIHTFYEEKLYDFKLLYGGIEMVETEIGEIRAHKTHLLMPPNKVFPNEKGIVAWISADANHLPLKIEAEMFFGKAYCELTSYRNIKYGPDSQ